MNDLLARILDAHDGMDRWNELKVIPGAPYGMCTTHKDAINEALLAFVRR